MSVLGGIENIGNEIRLAGMLSSVNMGYKIRKYTYNENMC
jgi:hypothetical protein